MFYLRSPPSPPNVTLLTKFNLHTSFASTALKQTVFDGLENVFTSRITVKGSVSDGFQQFVCVIAIDRYALPFYQ